ncbi:C40 family peptidase [Rhizobium leguminosarum]|uniref:C40 family peptidase n=1 Tax=Rhizobium leguminosarum TaxID=384 RepID=UPI00140F7E09|nr:NlpC/P60 family protein [Rhizobium leguminosarum]QIO64771.1 C40 family peptidase [Rhizobium leguminosarum bv. trifolii]
MERFVGIPYVELGRTYEAADCWGVFRLYYRDVRGILLPSYLDEMEGREFRRNNISPLVATEKEHNWDQVDRPETGDAILMRVGRDESHVGVFIGNGQMLHSEGPHPSQIERMGDMRWRSRIAGYFRYRSC